MKFKDPETEKVFEDIWEAMDWFCYESLRDCTKCTFRGKDCRKPWVCAHPAEAARIMGYEVINEEDTMEKKEKPRLAEILGVEVGERFKIKYGNGDILGPFCVDAEGYMRWTDEDEETSDDAIYIAINHPESVIRTPRLTDSELAIYVEEA